MRRETRTQARRRHGRASASNVVYEGGLQPNGATFTASEGMTPWQRLRAWFGGWTGAGSASRPIRIAPGPPIPEARAPKTPVRTTHEHSAIAYRMLAAVAAIDEWAARVRGRMRARLRKREAILRLRAWQAKRANSVESTAGKHVDTYEQHAVPPEQRHKLEPRRGIQRLIPVALVLADTAIMERPWTLWGGAFGNSQLETVLLGYLRAFLIAFALVWLLRLAGSKLRHAIVVVSGQHGEKVGHAGAIVMSFVALAGAFLLAIATSRLQGTLFGILGGGTSTTISDGTFRLIVMFLILASFASGYFFSAPEADEAARVRHPHRSAQRANVRVHRRLARAEARVNSMAERVSAFEQRVDARKREQTYLALEEMAEKSRALHELTGLEAANDPWQLLLDTLHPAGEGRGDGPASNGHGPKDEQRRRRAVDHALAERGGGDDGW